MKAVRSLIFAIVFILVFLVFKAPVFAQGTVPTTNYQTRDLNVWSQNVVYEVMSAFSCQLAGVNFSHKDQKCLGFDVKTGKLGFVDNGGGALGLLTGGIAMLYTAPAHTSEYVSYLSQTFGISKPLYAQNQGVGFDSINPLIGVWGVFRDISYLLFIFVFIIIGVAIMLRAKIDPRTVMTIQNQIPKLIIGIIMVTLSFAVAGFLIDIMWTSTYVVINVMGNADKNISVRKASEGLYNHPISYFDLMGTNGDQNDNKTGEFGGVVNLSQNGAGSIQNVINSSFGQVPLPNQTGEKPEEDNCADIFCDAVNFLKKLPIQMPGLSLLLGVANVVTNPFESVMSGVVGFLVSWLIGGIAFFIIIILLLWNLFKLWLTLLKCYVGILVDIIFAPFWIVGGLIPGASSLGFTGWVKDLLGNLAVFPATVGVFLLAKLFIDMSFIDLSERPFFVPPLLGHFSGGINTLGPLIALGFILAAPHVAEGVKKSFKEKFSIDLSGVGDSLKVGQGMGLAFLGSVRNRFYKEYQSQSGERTARGMLKEPIGKTKGTIASTFWNSRAGTNKFVDNVAKKLALGPHEKDDKGNLKHQSPGGTEEARLRVQPQAQQPTPGTPTYPTGASTPTPTHPNVTVNVPPPAGTTPPPSGGSGAANTIATQQTEQNVRNLRRDIRDLPARIINRLRGR